MSQLKLKQILGPGQGNIGAVVLYDGDTPVWSTSSDSALALPSGTTAERPSTTREGFIRYNTDILSLESYINGKWVDLSSMSAASYVVDNIAGRDALQDLKLGDSVFVRDIGTGKWGYYFLETLSEPVVPADWLLLMSEDLQDRSAIFSDDLQTYVRTQETGNENKVVLGTYNNTVLEVVGSPTVTTGEKIAIETVANEVTFVASNNNVLDNVDIRLVPNNEGHVFLGEMGSGIVEGEGTFDLYVRGGKSDGLSAPGDLFLTGGLTTTGDFNGGNVIIRPTLGSGTGLAGKTVIEDENELSIIEFATKGDNSGNWLIASNGLNSTDELEAGVIFGVADNSVNANVPLYLNSKGSGLVKSLNTNYNTLLAVNGNNDAFVTKGYLLDLVGTDQPETQAGVGLTLTNGVLDINLGANLIKADTANNLFIPSSTVLGQVLVSTGDNTEEAIWGTLELSNEDLFTGVLPVQLGGTGVTTVANGDLLVGVSNTLTPLNRGLDNQVLTATSSFINYEYISALRGDNGAVSLSTISVSSAVNNLEITNSAAGDPIVIGAVGTDSTIDILLTSTGLIRARAGYTVDLADETDDDVFATKGYIDSQVGKILETYNRSARFTTGWSSTMNIGLPTPNHTDQGLNVYISRVLMNVFTPLIGSGVSQALVRAGSNIIMEMFENDILVQGTYIADLNQQNTANNTQISITFYSSDGSTVATPSAGDVEIIVHYEVR